MTAGRQLAGSVSGLADPIGEDLVERRGGGVDDRPDAMPVAAEHAAGAVAGEVGDLVERPAALDQDADCFGRRLVAAPAGRRRRLDHVPPRRGRTLRRRRDLRRRRLGGWQHRHRADSRTLLAHWNGRAWTEVTDPSPLNGTLVAVTATSARNAWAVGYTDSNGGGAKTLILHWNGKKWKRVPVLSLEPADSDALTAVAATSDGNAWAVGSTSKRAVDPPPGH
jgi:hypothetical protein